MNSPQLPPIHTNVPGLEVCELFPRHAKCADKFTLVRSVHHDFADHGGGRRTGQIVGATNAKGEHPVERVLTPNDLWATVYRRRGIDYTESFPDFQGRPLPILPFGEPIEELLPARA